MVAFIKDRNEPRVVRTETREAVTVNTYRRDGSNDCVVRPKTVELISRVQEG